MTEGAWLSKAPSAHTATTRRIVASARNTAHYVVDGRPVCEAVEYRNGPALSPFKIAGWVPLRVWDKKCTLCGRVLNPPSPRPPAGKGKPSTNTARVRVARLLAGQDPRGLGPIAPLPAHGKASRS